MLDVEKHARVHVIRDKVLRMDDFRAAGGFLRAHVEDAVDRQEAIGYPQFADSLHLRGVVRVARDLDLLALQRKHIAHAFGDVVVLVVGGDGFDIHAEIGERMIHASAISVFGTNHDGPIGQGNEVNGVMVVMLVGYEDQIVLCIGDFLISCQRS